MAEYYNVTTNLGDAEIANAIATNTKLNITHVAFGDGNGSVPTPNKARTSLVREVHRQAVTKYERHATNANWIVIETIIPSGVGGFTIREMGIIANGKLISHGSHAPFEKVADPSGVSEYRLRFTQNVTDGSVVEIMLDESLIYASQAWTDEHYIPRSEIVDDVETDDATKPVSAKQAKNLQDNKLGKNDNAVSASKLETARKINGVEFDATKDIDLPIFGYKQKIRDVTAFRFKNVEYTNNEKQMIFVKVKSKHSTTSSNKISIYVDDKLFDSNDVASSIATGLSVSAFVPPGSSYRFEALFKEIEYVIELGAEE
ncbi:phage tail protein [Acinetobacter sp. YH1901141]|uniref:phage tail-collar fiber domain-containing protein n=1 Tax=Acinetobacter sp. YH1901141 TaxID=2601201 RepID=UPI0015D4294E|nr:phage tail protein [Acinetobacter sp. YH1901141]